MGQLNDFLESNLAVAGGVLGLVCLLLVIVVAVQGIRIRRLGRRLDMLTRGADGHDLAGVLETHLDTVMRVAGDVEALAARTTAIEGNARLAFQRLGLVRFNPFEDTGGNQSFAVALLNAEDNGVVVSSLHSRNGTRMYAKAIGAARAEMPLSNEETQAVELARRGPAARAVGGRSGDGARPAGPAPSAAEAVRAAGRPAAGPRVAPPGGDGRDEALDGTRLDRRLAGRSETPGETQPPLWGDQPRP